jgi:hypothetical protein
MFLFLFVAGLLLFLALCKAVVHFAKPKNARRAWLWIFALLLFVCTADHIAGYLYGRIWVALAKDHTVGVIETDSVAFKYSKQPLHRTWYDPLGDTNFDPWPPGMPREVYASFLAANAAAGFAVVQGYPKNYDSVVNFGQPFEVRISMNLDDPACRWWDRSETAVGKLGWNEDRIEKKKWLDQVRKNWGGGEHAGCPALHPISGITAKYLVGSYYNIPATPLEEALGLSEFNKIQLVDLKRDEIVHENRTVRFRGGWAARFLSIGYELGLGSIFARQIGVPQSLAQMIRPAHRPSIDR